MIITISGHIGSGKSTVAKLLSERLGWPFFGVGKLRREAAKFKGMSLEEFNSYGEDNFITDSVVDDYQAELGRTQDNFIIDGRLSWHFIPRSFKVFFIVDSQIGARRILQELKTGNRKDEFRDNVNLRTVVEINKRRMVSDKSRYEKYYHLNPYDLLHYDLVVDTSNLSPQEVVAQLLERLPKTTSQ